VLTGGEPLLQRDMIPLTKALRVAGRFVTIETAGTIVRDVHADLMSISPKRANSTPRNAGNWSHRHEEQRHHPDVMRQLLARYRCQVKLVIDTPGDLEDIERYLADFPEIAREQVWLMPQAITREALAEKQTWLRPAAENRGFHYAHRLHIELYGNTRGT
jgi:7-carboxy-7-deazaguanine synthase